MVRNSRLRFAAALSALIALAVFAAAPAFAVPNLETNAYWSVRAEVPYAPYTADWRATSIHAYYSVVSDALYAPYTVNDLKRTSLLPYWSVLH